MMLLVREKLENYHTVEAAVAGMKLGWYVMTPQTNKPIEGI